MSAGIDDPRPCAYPMGEFLGDVLLDQQQPAQALKEYETSLRRPTSKLTYQCPTDKYREQITEKKDKGI